MGGRSFCLSFLRQSYMYSTYTRVFILPRTIHIIHTTHSLRNTPRILSLACSIDHFLPHFLVSSFPLFALLFFYSRLLVVPSDLLFPPIFRSSVPLHSFKQEGKSGRPHYLRHSDWKTISIAQSIHSISVLPYTCHSFRIYSLSIYITPSFRDVFGPLSSVSCVSCVFFYLIFQYTFTFVTASCARTCTTNIFYVFFLHGSKLTDPV